MKKIVSVLIIICILLCFSPVCIAADTELPFTDLDKNAWYYDDIKEAYYQGIMMGVSDTKFEPDAPVTREMFLTAFARAIDADFSYTNPDNRWQDIDYQGQPRYYTNSIFWMANQKIAYGVDENLFGLGLLVTREEIAVFIDRMLNNDFLVLPQTDNVEDIKDVPSQWADKGVKTMLSSGVMRGKGNGIFAPKDNATRAEVAAVLLRLTALLDKATAKFEFSSEKAVMIIIDGYENGDFVDEQKYFTEDTEEILKFVEYINAMPVTHAKRLTRKTGWPEKATIFTIKNRGTASQSIVIYEDGVTIRTESCEYTVLSEYLLPIIELLQSK